MRRCFLFLPVLLAALRVAAEPGSLKIVDGKGLPVAAAAVMDAALPPPAAGAPAPPPLATSDAEGTLPWPKVAQVSVHAPGFLPWIGAPAEVITLTRPSTISLRALDSDTRVGVAGVTVRLFPAGKPGVEPAETDSLRSAVTAKDGKAAFTDLPAAAYRLRLDMPGRVTLWTKAAPAPEATDHVTADLRRALSIEGHVHDVKLAVAAAIVRTLPARPRRMPFGGAPPESADDAVRKTDIKTDAAGHFRLDQIPVKRQTAVIVVVLAPDGRFGVELVEPARETGLAAKSSSDVIRLDFDLAKQASVSGMVTWDDGTPAPGVRVVAEIPLEFGAGAGRMKWPYGASLLSAFEDLGGGPESWSGPDGAFVLAGLPQRAWRLVAEPEGRASSEPVTADLTVGDIGAIALIVPKGASVSGVVLDKSGKPIAEAKVTGSARRGPGRMGAGSGATADALTGKDGRFELAGLPQGDLEIEVEAEGFGRKAVEAAPGADLKIVLVSCGTVSGRVVGADTSLPVPRFEVSLAPEVEEMPPPRGRRNGRQNRQEFTSPDGSFLIEDVEEGRWIAVVHAEGYLTKTLPAQDVTAGQDAGLGDLVLEVGARVTGRVVDADSGAPIVGASVRILGAGGAASAWGGGMGRGGAGQAATEPQSASGSDGSFVLEGVSVGDFTVSAEHVAYPKRASHEARVNIPAEGARSASVTLKLEAGGSIHGQVRDAAGTPVAAAWIEVVAATTPDSGRQQGPGAANARGWGRSTALAPPVQSDDQGQFLVAALPEGAVKVRRTDRMGSQVDAIVRKGQVTEVLLGESGARVFGRVLLGETPIPSIVQLATDTGRSPITGFSDTYSIDGVAAGEWTLNVQVQEPKPDGTTQLRREREKITVSEGVRELPHDIRLEPTEFGDDVAVSGLVKDVDSGEGLANFVVSSRRIDPAVAGEVRPRTPTYTRTNDQGRFELILPGDGTHELTAMATGPFLNAYQVLAPIQVIVQGGVPDEATPVLLARKRLEAELRIVDAAGRGVGGAACSLLSPDFNMTPGGLRLGRPPAMSDGTGKVVATAGEAGPHDMLVVIPARLVMFVPRVDVPGQAVTSVVLPATGDLRVDGAQSFALVEQSTGSNWWVRIAPGQDMWGLARPDGDGMLVRGLPEGTWLVKVGDVAQPVVISAGQLATLQL